MCQTKPLNGRGKFFRLFYVFFYGFFAINYIDHVAAPHTAQGYHAWLTFMYFAPFLLFYDWKTVVVYGLIVSLLNDLFYAPFGNFFLGKSYNLLDWYSFQLGRKSSTLWWFYDAGFFKIRVTSLTMFASILMRLEIILFLAVYPHALAKVQKSLSGVRHV
jgi:hypothetical protein